MAWGARSELRVALMLGFLEQKALPLQAMMLLESPFKPLPSPFSFFQVSIENPALLGPSLLSCPWNILIHQSKSKKRAILLAQLHRGPTGSALLIPPCRPKQWLLHHGCVLAMKHWGQGCSWRNWGSEKFRSVPSCVGWIQLFHVSGSDNEGGGGWGWKTLGYSPKTLPRKSLGNYFFPQHSCRLNLCKSSVGVLFIHTFLSQCVVVIEIFKKNTNNLLLKTNFIHV